MLNGKGVRRGRGKVKSQRGKVKGEKGGEVKPL